MPHQQQVLVDCAPSIYAFLGSNHYLQSTLTKELCALYTQMQTQQQKHSLSSLWKFGADHKAQLALLDFVHTNGYKFEAVSCALAATCGQLDVLQCLRLKYGCPWDLWTCAHAAKEGHLAVLQWARAQGCPWNALVCTMAASRGHLALLQWARAHGCAWDSWTTMAAAENGHLGLLQWALAQGCLGWRRLCSAAAQGGHLHVLKWLRLHVPGVPCPWDATVTAYAALGGHLELLQWATAQGCEWHSMTCLYASRSKARCRSQDRHVQLLHWCEQYEAQQR